MVRAYLLLNAGLYIALAIWCTLLPESTSASIGFEFRSAAAKSEYITVYGGLELGLGLFFLLSAMRPTWQQAALGFSACLYGCLALFRSGTLLFLPDLGAFPWAMLAIELPMAIAALALLRRHPGSAQR